MSDAAQTTPPPHITICICTFKRPHLLKQTLEQIGRIETQGLFTYSVVVADNDWLESARDVVNQSRDSRHVEILYFVEPEQNIARARNLAVNQAKGDFLAFIDDDEFPKSDWLLTAFQACNEFNCDGVLGPVKPYFDQKPPDWLVRGNFCIRPEHASGTVLNCRQTRTGNALLRSKILQGVKEPFNPQYGNGGEDSDFFKRMIRDGHVFLWCNESVVFEVVPPERWTRRYLLKRALLRGQIEYLNADYRSIMKSMIAVPLYLTFLPFLLVSGQHRFMKFLIRMGDHLGKLFGVLGWKPLGDKYLGDTEHGSRPAKPMRG